MTTWDYTPTCRGFDYFYGYWNAAQDYYTHGGPHAGCQAYECRGLTFALDLHENFSPVTDEAGAYSTNLYTAKAQAWVQKTVGAEKASHSFLYLAYQAMHGCVTASASASACMEDECEQRSLAGRSRRRSIISTRRTAEASRRSTTATSTAG